MSDLSLRWFPPNHEMCKVMFGMCGLFRARKFDLRKTWLRSWVVALLFAIPVVWTIDLTCIRWSGPLIHVAGTFWKSPDGTIRAFGEGQGSQRSPLDPDYAGYF